MECTEAYFPLSLSVSLSQSPPLQSIPVRAIIRHGNPVPHCLTDKCENEAKHGPPGQRLRRVGFTFTFRQLLLSNVTYKTK